MLQALGKQNLKKDSFFKLFDLSDEMAYNMKFWNKLLKQNTSGMALIGLFFFYTRINWSFNTVSIQNKVLLNTEYANQLKLSPRSHPALPWDEIMQHQGHGLLAKCKPFNLVVIPLPTLKTLQWFTVCTWEASNVLSWRRLKTATLWEEWSAAKTNLKRIKKIPFACKPALLGQGWRWEGQYFASTLWARIFKILRHPWKFSPSP